MKKSVGFGIIVVTLSVLANEPQMDKKQGYQEFNQGRKNEIQQRQQVQKTVQEKELKREREQIKKKQQYPRGSIATH